MASNNGTIPSSSTESATSSSVSSIISSIIFRSDTSSFSSTPSSTPPSSTPTPSSSEAPPSTTVFTTAVSSSGTPITHIVTITSLATVSSNSAASSTGSSSTSTTAAASLSNTQNGTANSGKLSAAGKTAIAVVIPVVVVALLVLAGIFFWRKRKQRKNSEEARRKEVEDYGYNPNNDPTLPAVGAAAGSEMMEDSSGYRGWGNVTTSTSNRKTSTTLSGGHTAVSDTGSQGGYRSPGSPTQDGANSVEPLMGANRRATGDSDGIGALGQAPAAGANRTDIRRGPSNASSSYSAGNRSEESDGQAAINSPQDLYTDNAYYQAGPYGENQYGGNQQPVIRDVQARRNTRIESPTVFPHQGNSGIAQNF